MKLTLLTVGEMKSHPLKRNLDDYLDRIRKYYPVDVAAIRAARAPEFPDFRHAALDESKRLLDKLAPQDFVVVMDERGQVLRSETMAERLNGWMLGGHKRIVFVVGGAFGLGPAVKARANFLLSLSPMTLPHELAATLLTEQLYRALTILHKHPYHYGGEIK